jgi:diguanylate cyclase (GGDEF)-like protein/PAS domain S-box-containing protein
MQTALLFPHDLRLLALAAIVCLLGSVTTMRLFQRAWTTDRRARAIWLSTASVAGGCSVWSTHFIAMLSCKPGFEIGYDLGTTITSFAMAITIPGLGFAAALAPGKRSLLIGGVVAGCGYAAMTWLGVSALVVPGELTLNPWLLIAPVILASVFVTLALAAASDRGGNRGLYSGALCFLVGIFVVHAFSMAAAEFTPDAARTIPSSSLPGGGLAVAIGAAALFTFTVSLICIIFDRRLEDRSLQEELRLRAFADAAVEGLVLCEDGVIQDVNRSFERLIGRDVADLKGARFEQLLDGSSHADTLDDLSSYPLETELIAPVGELIPVELVAREIPFHTSIRRIYAVRDLRERRAAERRIHHMAYHDSLTGLPNRTRFIDDLQERVAHATALKAQVAVLCIDLDRFKEVNDVFGHPAGDQLLRKLAEQMEEVALPTETLARLGGDEFVVIQSGVEQPQGAEELAERLLGALCGNVTLEQGVTVRSAASIGIAIFPQDGATADAVHANADAALYRAKKEGRGTFSFFEAEMDLSRRARRTLQADMVRALENGEFHLHFQPQASTSTGVVSGFEALLRWHHPVRGAIEPSDFIPLAEETGFIVPLGEFALHAACAEAASWGNPLSIAVNLSPLQFRHGDLAATVQRVLTATGLDPKRLELEITEGVLMHDLDRALAILERIKAIGVCIAMDDFGTGYSSLSYLQTFPFDRIKIDRSFIKEVHSNRQSEAIVRAILSLGRGLDLPVLAEGVETEEQHSFLAGLDCENIQGFLVGRPQSIKLFDPILGGRTESEEKPDAA